MSNSTTTPDDRPLFGPAGQGRNDLRVCGRDPAGIVRIGRPQRTRQDRFYRNKQQ